MAIQLFRSPSRPTPRIEEVLAEIKYFRRRINEAGPADGPARRAAHAAYAPFLDRRIKLLAKLTAKSSESKPWDLEA